MKMVFILVKVTPKQKIRFCTTMSLSSFYHLMGLILQFLPILGKHKLFLHKTTFDLFHKMIRVMLI